MQEAGQGGGAGGTHGADWLLVFVLWGLSPVLSCPRAQSRREGSCRALVPGGGTGLSWTGLGLASGIPGRARLWQSSVPLLAGDSLVPTEPGPLP